ncbi:hypothetical protein Thiowin_04504 [Thiorhodovibrio winogradskyi]|uniref:Transposase n=1 Tax=Thiorhodovibrio winogradskyi TaxID=77007 RepID=A0ABZ0SEB9_9GAMM|nr:transposase [Thiorhodovibrio winogradskyi]
MSGFAERFIQQGLAQVLEEGRQEGRKEGEATILLHMLTKFGQQSDAIRQRVQAANAETLLRWSARVLTGDGLDAVYTEFEG